MMQMTQMLQGMQLTQAVPPLRIETGAAPAQASVPTQIVQRADAAAERAIVRATRGMPDWTLPAMGGVLIFVGVALLTRGVLARQAARAAVDPRVQAWAAVRRAAPRAVVGNATDASKLGEVTLRLLRGERS